MSDGYAMTGKDIGLYLTIIRLYEQQQYMYDNRVHSVEHRIVSISQPWLRPIVRGKVKAPVEFGAKFDLSLDSEGYGRIEKISFEAYNESTCLIEAKVQNLAYRLRGIAHTLVEEDTDVSKVLKESCHGMNSHHGSIGIYYPGSAAPYKIITTGRYEGREDLLIDRVVNMVCRYMNQQARDKMMTWEGIQNELLKLRYVSATEKKAKAENEVSEVYENFSDELEEKEHTIEELNNRVMALQAENQGLRAKYERVTEIPIIYYGVEAELYEGEIKDQILEMLQKQMTQVKKNTRKEHILQDILECNEISGALDEKRTEIKRILKGYTKVGDNLKRDLKAYGFSIVKEGGHYKLIYKGDNRYLFTMAASGSDSQHGGGNLSAEIIRDML